MAYLLIVFVKKFLLIAAGFLLGDADDDALK